MNLAVLREADQVFVEHPLTGVSRDETGVGDGFGEEDHRGGVPVSAVLPGVPAAIGTRDLGPRQRSRPPAGCFPLCSALFDPPGPCLGAALRNCALWQCQARSSLAHSRCLINRL